MKFNLGIENINYMKILYANENEHPVSIKVAIKKIEEREIVTCFKFEDDLNIKVPQQVTISIICSEGLYRTKTLLKSYYCKAPYIFMYLETPKSLEFQQNREYFRIPVAYKAVYHVNNNGQNAAFDTTTVDLSANGVSIIMPAHVFSEEDAEIEMMIEEKSVKAKIQYVRSEKTDAGYKLSFKFTELSARDKDFISQVCIKKQLEEKRNKKF